MLRTLCRMQVAVVMLVACNRAPEETSATRAEPSEELSTPVAKSDNNVVLEVQPDSANVSFEMNAPLERQFGEVPSDAVQGSLSLDLQDVTQSTGLIRVDLDDLVIYQAAREDEESEFAEREKNETQNKHMHDWLEIGEDAPPEQREKNRWIEFALQDVKNESVADLTTLTGKERKVTLLGIGELRLHQRKTPKEIALEAVLHVKGDELQSVEVKTVTPFLIDLEAHDVRPRTAFGTLAQKTLQAMSPKVASKAVVSVSFTAVPRQPVRIVSAAAVEGRTDPAAGGGAKAPASGAATEVADEVVPTAAAEEGY